MSVEFLYDQPNRANASTPGTPDFGPAYQNMATEEWKIVSNEFSATGLTMPFNGIEAGAGRTDHGMELTVLAISTQNFQIGVRGTAFTSSWTGYTVEFTAAGGVNFKRVLNGSNTTLFSSVSGAWSIGDRIGVAVKGTVIYAFVNGRVVHSVSDATYSTGTKMHWACQNNVTVPRCSNLRAFTIAADPSYPFHPSIGWRMPYHVDGSTVTLAAGTSGSPSPSAVAAEANDEDTTTAVAWSSNVIAPNPVIQVGFPEPRIVTAVFLSGSGSTAGLTYNMANAAGSYASSGTGQDLATNWSSLPSGTAWRTAIKKGWLGSDGVTGTPFGLCRGINFSASADMQPSITTLHIYGYIPQQSGVHRTRLWHPYLDIPLPGDYFDLDDIGRGTLRTREFRIKNQSMDMTANGISVDVQSLMYGTTLTDQFGLRKASDSPGVYVPTGTLTSLAPLAVSERFEFRRITPNNQSNPVEAPSIRVQTGSYT